MTENGNKKMTGNEIRQKFLEFFESKEHRRVRGQQVIRALRQGHSTVPAVAESIYDGLGPALMTAARMNVRAHLEKLKIDGLAFDEGEHWKL